MKYAADLTDLLNNDPQAYTYFYALPAQTQTDLAQAGHPQHGGTAESHRGSGL